MSLILKLIKKNMTVDRLIIYHNPSCSKSTETLQILQQNNKTPRVIEYLKNPPDELQLKEIIKMLGIPASDLIRTTEQAYIDAKLEESATDEQIIEAICTQPVLLQRPIVISGSRAVIGRPPIKVLEII
jgi:arsenate reductase